MWILIGTFQIRQNLTLLLQKNACCLTEKYHIIFSAKGLLNKRNELVAKCRHENKLYLQITKTPP